MSNPKALQDIEEAYREAAILPMTQQTRDRILLHIAALTITAVPKHVMEHPNVDEAARQMLELINEAKREMGI